MLFNNSNKKQKNNHLILYSIILILISQNFINSTNNKIKKTSSLKSLKEKNTKNSLRKFFTNFQTKTSDYNGGSWDDGFKCPEFLIGKGTETQVDQGGVLLKAKEIVGNSTPDNSKGFIIEFENIPKADNLIYKVATQINNSKKFYIPWRYVQADVDYNNPYFGNKTLKGSLFSDDKVTYNYTIKLPYKYVGWYINDEQGYKIRDYMIQYSNKVRETIKSTKTKLGKKANEYFDASENSKKLEDVKKNSQQLQTQVKKNQEELDKEENTLKDLNAQRKTLQQQVTKLNNELILADSDYDKLVNELNNSNKDIVLLNEWIEKVEKGKDTSSLLQTQNKNAAEALQAGENEYNKLLISAEERKSFIEESRKGFKNEDRGVYQSNLDKIYP